MNRLRTVATFTAVCIISGAVGYWFGFREALPLGVAADFLPRGSIAIYQLDGIRSGKTQNTITGLEFDVDQGLIWGDKLFSHPLRNYLVVSQVESAGFPAV
jgi:hypothetical protein